MFFFKGKKKPPENHILFMLDVENIAFNVHNPQDDQPSMRFPEEELNIFMAKLGKIGQFAPHFAFAPTSFLNRYSEELHKLGFVVVECPTRVRDKTGEAKIGKQDVVDPTLIEFARKMMPLLKKAGLTHLCLGSADGDFIPVIRDAINLGLDIILLAGNAKINSELRQLVENCKGQIFTLYDIK